MTDNLLAIAEQRLAALRGEAPRVDDVPDAQLREYERYEEHEIRASNPPDSLPPEDELHELHEITVAEGPIPTNSPGRGLGISRNEKHERHDIRPARPPVRVGQRWAIRADGDPWKLRRGGEVMEITAVIGDAIGYRFAVLGIRGVMRLVDLRKRCTRVPTDTETI
jgi:hypothetical protein